MRWTTMTRWLPLALLAAGLTLPGPAPAKEEDKDGFKPIFNGKNFDGWKMVLADKGADPAKTWSIHKGVIICTGKPNGFLYTAKGFKNYVFRYDWRYRRPKDLKDDSKFLGNSGALIHIHNPTKPAVGGLWPQCVEVQGMNRDHGLLLFLKTKGKGKFDRKAKDKAVRKVGEWNTTEITCKGDGTILCNINGTKVSSGKSRLTEGQIGFQSEGAEIHFRKILIKQLEE
jgi:hypothetical protein